MSILDNVLSKFSLFLITVFFSFSYTPHRFRIEHTMYLSLFKDIHM